MARANSCYFCSKQATTKIPAGMRTCQECHDWIETLKEFETHEDTEPMILMPGDFQILSEFQD